MLRLNIFTNNAVGGSNRVAPPAGTHWSPLTLSISAHVQKIIVHICINTSIHFLGKRLKIVQFDQMLLFLYLKSRSLSTAIMSSTCYLYVYVYTCVFLCFPHRMPIIKIIIFAIYKQTNHNNRWRYYPLWSAQIMHLIMIRVPADEINVRHFRTCRLKWPCRTLLSDGGLKITYLLLHIFIISPPLIGAYQIF